MTDETGWADMEPLRGKRTTVQRMVERSRAGIASANRHPDSDGARSLSRRFGRSVPAYRLSMGGMVSVLVGTLALVLAPAASAGAPMHASGAITNPPIRS